jgi:cysteine-rich secretory family protein
MLALGLVLIFLGFLFSDRPLRIALGTLALCAFGVAIGLWVAPLFSSEGLNLNTEAERAEVRLEIVGRVNHLRHQHGLESLTYNPALSLVAQQRADYGAASNSGIATEESAGTLPSEKTNMWAEMAGMSCSWQRLFEVGKGRPLSPTPELGFIEDGQHVGPSSPPPYLSSDFYSVGVGVEQIPGGGVSVVMELVGPAKRGIPWLQGMPNLLGKVFVDGAPPTISAC